jgi:hypothetical protein
VPQFSIKDLAKIIERDSKDATYKYALLRGSIEIIQENDNYRRISGETVSFPVGLLVLKWIEYYYPIICSRVFIPQKHGDSRERSIAFRREFEKVISYYSGTENSYPLFYDLKKGITRPDLGEAVWQLVRKIRDTLIRQPMHYIGSAIDRGGEIYRYNKDAKRTRVSGYLSIESIIGALGTFSIPIELYHVMQVVGSFVTGTHSLIFRWAEFTSGIANNPDISTSKMISLLKSDFNERDIARSKDYYARILENYPRQFRSEVQIALLGNTAFSPKGWKNDSYEQLIRISHHLIEDRGFSPWIINESI